jgi:nucleoside-diphosphate-sugar epimerase
VLLALDAPNAQLQQRVFNIGSLEETSDRDTARALRKLIPGAEIKLQGGGVNRRAFDISAAREQLKFEPQYDLEAGIKDHIALYRAYQQHSASE